MNWSKFVSGVLLWFIFSMILVSFFYWYKRPMGNTEVLMVGGLSAAVASALYVGLKDDVVAAPEEPSRPEIPASQPWHRPATREEAYDADNERLNSFLKRYPQQTPAQQKTQEEPEEEEISQPVRFEGTTTARIKVPKGMLITKIKMLDDLEAPPAEEAPIQGYPDVASQ